MSDDLRQPDPRVVVPSVTEGGTADPMTDFERTLYIRQLEKQVAELQEEMENAKDAIVSLNEQLAAVHEERDYHKAYAEEMAEILKIAHDEAAKQLAAVQEELRQAKEELATEIRNAAWEAERAQKALAQLAEKERQVADSDRHIASLTRDLEAANRRVNHWMESAQAKRNEVSAEQFHAAKLCRKVPHDHDLGGYLHDETDDSLYAIDGVSYCGRCHWALSVFPIGQMP